MFPLFVAALPVAERSRALESSIWAGSSYTVEDLLAIDKEGRVVITDHGASGGGAVVSACSGVFVQWCRRGGAASLHVTPAPLPQSSSH